MKVVNFHDQKDKIKELTSYLYFTISSIIGIVSVLNV